MIAEIANPSLKQKKTELGSDTLQKFTDNFYNDPKNVLALNACTKYDPLEMCLSRKRLEEIGQHVFTTKVTSYHSRSLSQPMFEI